LTKKNIYHFKLLILLVTLQILGRSKEADRIVSANRSGNAEIKFRIQVIRLKALI